jgi:hypothetical protein
MSPANSDQISAEDLERLANRVAQLAGYDQDADNAGRAIGAMARRMGISGSELREWLLAGANRYPQHGGEPEIRAPDQSEVARLERALANSQHSLRVVEAQLRHSQSERDALKEETALLVASLDRARSSEQVRRYVGIAAVAAAILGAAVLAFGPALRPAVQDDQSRPFGSPFLGTGVIRGNATPVYRAPEAASPVITQLTSGARVGVRQTVDRSGERWVEVEVGGVVGYVQSAAIDIADPSLR